jgi:RluA family pseudouridine synthase
MEIIFEDRELIIVNKPAGVIVEGADAGTPPSLTDQIQKRVQQEVFPCHRLDRDTTGIVVFAKKKQALKHAFAQFSNRSVRKTYLAVVDGDWDPAWNRVETKIKRQADGSMANSIDGKVALTTFHRLSNWDGKSLLQILPKTGRTHQIRLHCLYHNCPVSGDSLYGKRTSDHPPMALHAWQIQFHHPKSGEPMLLKASLPVYWANYWLKDCPYELDL